VTTKKKKASKMKRRGRRRGKKCIFPRPSQRKDEISHQGKGRKEGCLIKFRWRARKCTFSCISPDPFPTLARVIQVQNPRCPLSGSTSTSEFLLAHVNGTAFLGCNVPEPDIRWSHAGAEVDQWLIERSRPAPAPPAPGERDWRGGKR